MADPLVVISRYRVKQGKLKDLRRYLKNTLRIIEANEPQVIAFHEFLTEDGTEMTSIQVHPNTASMDAHMQVLSDNWESLNEFGEILEVIGVEYYGTPSKSALEMDLESGVPIRLYPRHVSGFTKSPSGRT